MSATTRWALTATVLAALLAASAALGADGNIPFEKVVIDPKMAGDCKMVADIDGDGRPDLIIGGTKGSEELVWYHNPKWTKSLIGKATTEFTTLGTGGDIDGDGDVDIIVPDGGGQDNLLWFENPRPKGDPFRTEQWKRHAIGTVGGLGKDVYAGDLDGDGRLDVVAHGPGTLMIFFRDGPDRWRKLELKGFRTGDEGLGAGDVNGDGLVDLISCGVWLENPGEAAARDPVRWKAMPIGEFDKDFKAVVADINGDGRKDIVTCSSEGVADLVWWEPVGGDPRGKWASHVVAKALEKSHTLAVADMDGDGYLDIVSGQMHTSREKETVIWRNVDGRGLAWRKEVVDKEGIHNGVVADIDGDGRLDIFAVNWSTNPPARVFFSRRPTRTSGPATSRAASSQPATGPFTGWGAVKASIGDGPEGDGTVLLENRAIRVLYTAKRFGDNNKDHVITDFLAKKTGGQLAVGDQIDGIWMNADEGRGKVTAARVVHDGPDRKTLRVEWDMGKVIQEFTLWPDLPILRIDYIKYGINIVDMVKSVDSYEVYGAKAWQEARAKMGDGNMLNHPNPHHRLTKDLYPRYPFPLLAVKDWGNVEPSELSYKDHIILGAYSKATGLGFGRATPVQDTNYVKLLSTGFEVFANWRQPHRPFTAYLFGVTGGPEELMAVGKTIAEGTFLDR